MPVTLTSLNDEVKMMFSKTTVAIGITSCDNVTRIVELSNPIDCKGRTLDQVVFIKGVHDANEWNEAAYHATFHSKHEHRITSLQV